MRAQHNDNERGYSLLEVLAAITILSIVTLVLSSYFTNSLSYSKKSQNKTVMVNLARNALFYMEKQKFSVMSAYFTKTDPLLECAPAREGSDACSNITTLLKAKPDTVKGVFSPLVNGIQYQVSIRYEEALYQEMLTSNEDSRRNSAKYLLPVMVTVKAPGDQTSQQNQANVEGYITDETIR